MADATWRAGSDAGADTPIENHTSAADRRGLFMVIMGAVFLVAAEARVIAPLLPAIAFDLHASLAQAGLLITAYSIPYGMFQLVYGPLADRYSRQRVMGFALGLFALGTLASAFAPSFLALQALRIATGAAAAGVVPVALAFVGDAVPYAQRQAALGRVVSVAALGGVMSAALGGVIASAVSWRAMFGGYGVLALVLAVVLLAMPRRRARPAARQPQSALAPYRAIWRTARTGMAALGLLFFMEGLAATGTLALLGAMLFERHGLSSALIGALLTVNSVGMLLTGRAVGALVRRVGEQGMLLLGGTAMTLGYLVVGREPWLLCFPVAMLISGAGFTMVHSTLQALATEVAPAQRGTAVALLAFALFLGGGIGTFTASLLIAHAGYGATLLATAAALGAFTLSAVPLLRIVRRAC